MKSRFLLVASLFAFVLPTMPAIGQQSNEEDVVVGSATVLRLNVSGDVELLPQRGSHIIHIRGNSPVGAPPLRIASSRTGARLNLTMSGPARAILPFTASGHAYRVSYPANLRLDVRQFTGAVSLAHPISPVQIYNANGAITVDSPAAALTAEADNGDIVVTNARGTLELTTGNGNVNAQLSPGWAANLVRMESSNGDLRLSVPAGFRGRYDLASALGSVRNSHTSIPRAPLVFMLTERGNVTVSAPPL